MEKCKTCKHGVWLNASQIYFCLKSECEVYRPKICDAYEQDDHGWHPFRQEQDEWIPISKETNPAKSGWYLVTVHENTIFDNERFTTMAEFNATDGVWYDIDEPTDMYLRWMPLPEPWKGEK